MEFRDKIKEICAKQKITQKELAARLEITAISLNKTLGGEYPQLQTLERIAKALNVHITELFEQPDIMPNSNYGICPKCGGKFMLKIEKMP